MDGFWKSELIAMRSLSPTVRQFTFAYPWSDQFLPGQFVMLDLPIEAEFTTRSYSIASAPNADGWIDLCVVKKPDGPGTHYLFDELNPGGTISISKPQGKFVMSEEKAAL